MWQIADIEACLPVEIPVSLKSSITAWLRQHLTPMEHAGSHTLSEAGSNTLSVHIPSPRGALSDSDASLLWGPQTNGTASFSQSQLDVDTSDLDDNAISYNFTLDKWHEEVQERFDSIVTEGGVDWPKQLLPATKNSALRTIMKMPYTDTLFLFRGDAWASISQATAESDLMKRRIIHMIREIPRAGHQTPENPVSSSSLPAMGTDAALVDGLGPQPCLASSLGSASIESAQSTTRRAKLGTKILESVYKKGWSKCRLSEILSEEAMVKVLSIRQRLTGRFVRRGL